MSASRPRTPASHELSAVGLILLLGAAWAVAPAFVRHQAGIEPLLHETVPVTATEPAGGAALRAIVEPQVDGYSWGAGFVEVRENGRPLARARPQAVRREGDGRYGVGQGGEILFAPSGTVSDAGAGGDAGAHADYTVRRPRHLRGWLLTSAIAAFAAMNVAVAVVLVRGLRRSRVLGRLAVWVPLAAAGWIAAEIALETALPWTGSDLLGQKMEQLLDDVDRYDAVFIGSSRIYRQLEPDTFDATFAAAGVPMRSFNLGVPDMRMLEVLFLARWLLHNQPERLDLLVVDAESDPLFIREENLLSDRIVRWHDGRNFAAIARQVRRASPTRATALYQIGRHAVPLVHHVTHLGRGLERIASRYAPVPREAPPEQRGFYAGDEEMVASPSAAQRAELELFHGRLHGDLDRFHRDVARLASSPRLGALTDPFEIELFAELERMTAGRGVRVVFLLDARPEETPNLVWAGENGVIGSLLRFDDPERYPDLYDPALRFDRHHVSKAGAKLYTAEVARRILAGPWSLPRPAS
ncbi:MAG TPA: hypothetical protein VMS86_06310 [Thermoanaerobaculia bacterium]|nr:hypothetical protein [Thermoanaerobaculia bacterium]